jgi:serine/threonine protein kinase
MTEAWAKWEKQIINGIFPLHRCVSFSDHSAVFLTEYAPLELPNALLKLVPAIPTLRQTQLAHWTAAATLAHPHLIRPLEAGSCQLGGLQFLFVVMEYAEATLANILTQQPLAPETVRKALRPILNSLAFLHRKRLVHGGLKPANILLVNRQLRLAGDSIRPTGESTPSIAGPSVYDPPESRDGSFSTAGDIWSLGVLMVEALTQHRPSWPDRHSGTAALPATLPPQFLEIVQRCLNRDPANRPTVAELEAQINPVPQEPMPEATGESVHYPVLLPPRYPVLLPPEPPDSTSPHLAHEEPDPLTFLQQSPPRRRSFVPAGAAMLILLIVVWTGLRLLASQAYSRPTALPAPTAQNPATGISAPAEVATASLDRGHAAESTPVVAPSVLHEEAPEVPLDALETIRGHIKFAVRVTVDRSGNVVHATLANHSPSRYFTRLAVETAGKWKFVAADNQDSRQWLLRFEFTRDGVTAHAGEPRTSKTDRAHESGGATELRQAKLD